MAILSEENKQEGREWAKTVARDRAERAIALKLARAMLAAAEHLRSMASGLAAEFELVKWQAGSDAIDEELVDSLLNGAACDLPICWIEEVRNAAPHIPQAVNDELDIGSDDIDAIAAIVRDRVQSVVVNLAGLNEVAG